MGAGNITTPGGLHNSLCIKRQSPITGKCLEHSKWLSQVLALPTKQFIGKFDRRSTHITMFMLNQSEALIFAGNG